VVPRCAGEPFAGLPRLNQRQLGKGHPSVVTKKNQNSWYVSIHLPQAQKTGHYSRRSETFASEAEAKQFAASKIAAGTEISAGTLNPVTPKRVIKPSEIEKWLAEKTNSPGDRSGC
jgi:hypothetical protein